MPFVAILGIGAILALALAKRTSAPAFGPNRLATQNDVEPGCPPEILTAINVALSVETDPSKLRAFAAQLRPYYPRAAAILESRAAQL